MTSLIRGEFTKLATTRGAAGILLWAIAISIVAFVAPGENAVAEFSKPLQDQQSFFFAALLMRVLLLVLGIRAVTEEFRHGTATPSLLASPRRSRFVAAKVASLAATGVVIAAASGAALLGTAQWVAAANNAELQLDASDWPTFVGMIAAGALWPVIGAGLGLIVRSQVAATVGGLVWLMAVEDIIRLRFDDLGTYLPGQAGLSLAVASTDAALVSALVLIAYAVAAAAGGTLLFRSRDVT
jgi:ABC-2 type transport system permease protein